MLRDLQADIVAYLHQWRDFDTVPIVTEDLGDVSTAVSLAINKFTRCALITTFPGGVQHTNTPRLFYDQILITITLMSYPLIDRAQTTFLPMQTLAERTLFLLLNADFKPQNSNLIARNPAISIASTPESDPGFSAFNVNMETSGFFDYEPQVTETHASNLELLEEAGIPILEEGGGPVKVE